MGGGGAAIGYNCYSICQNLSLLRGGRAIGHQFVLDLSKSTAVGEGQYNFIFKLSNSTVVGRH